MKKITKILILLSIPNQLFIILALFIHGGPFCYFRPLFVPPVDLRLVYGGPAPGYFQCQFGLDYYSLEPFLAYSLIITLPMMLAAFIIHLRFGHNDLQN